MFIGCDQRGDAQHAEQVEHVRAEDVADGQVIFLLQRTGGCRGQLRQAGAQGNTWSGR
jgi:hypothetical protein